MNETRNGGANRLLWALLVAMAVLTMGISGAFVSYVVADTREHEKRLAAVEGELRAVQSNHQETARRLGRMEDQLDRLVEESAQIKRLVR